MFRAKWRGSIVAGINVVYFFQLSFPVKKVNPDVIPPEFVGQLDKEVQIMRLVILEEVKSMFEGPFGIQTYSFSWAMPKRQKQLCL